MYHFAFVLSIPETISISHKMERKSKKKEKKKREETFSA